jgi:adenine phosphoribosyltransferase
LILGGRPILEKLKKSLEKAKVINLGNYDYLIHPIIDGFPALEPQILEDIVTAIVEVSSLECDKIVTVEAMGIPIAAALSMRTGIPFTVIRRRKYDLEGELEIGQLTGYSDTKLYVNALDKGDRILFVDDIISTGGTLSAVLEAFGEIGVEVADVIIAVDKGFGRKGVEEAYGIEVKCLVGLDIIEGKVVLRD